MRSFGIAIVCLGLAMMFLGLANGVITREFGVANWAGIAIGAWFSLIGCILIPRKK